MSSKYLVQAAAILAAVSLATASFAAPTFDASLDGLARGWAHANYEIGNNGAKADEAARLAAQADALARQNPGRAEPLVWEAILLATEAGAKGGMGALPLVKQSRDLLERAERINPRALGDGSVYTSLGSLYSQVPGFPIAFGDPAKARAYLGKALAINPTGIDPNFFYGDFLYRQKDYVHAEAALKKALAAPPRPGREVADRGRRAEAAALLAKVRAKL